jgi:hypothetical protein
MLENQTQRAPEAEARRRRANEPRRETRGDDCQPWCDRLDGDVLIVGFDALTGGDAAEGLADRRR